MKKNLVISANSSWNIYNFRMHLIRKLSVNNRVIIVAPYDKYTKKILEEGYKFVNIKLSRNSLSIFSNLIIFFNYLLIFIKYQPVAYLGFTIKPNIIGTFASIFFKKINSYNFITGLGTFFFSKTFLHKFILFFYKLVFIKSKIVFFQNNEDKEYFINQNIIKEKKSYLINGSGIDLDFYNNKTYPKINKNFVFLCISRINKDKGILEYIDAAKMIKKEFSNVEFQLLGEIDNKYNNQIDKDYLNESIDNKIIKHINFVEDVRNYIIKSDCIVLPSYREGSSRALLEGAALSKPLIASDVPGCNNIVKNNFNGYLFKAKNSVNTYEVMKKMLNLDIRQRNLMGKRSREYIKDKFEINLVNKSILEIIYMHI